MTIHGLQRRILRNAHGTVNLNRPVDHIMEHGGAGDLDQRYFDSGLITLIDLARCIEGQHTGLLDLGGTVEDEFLDLLMLSKRLSE